MIDLPPGCRGRNNRVKIQLREGSSVEGGIVGLECNCERDCLSREE